MTKDSKDPKENATSKDADKKPAKDGKELTPEELARVTGGTGNAAYYESQRVKGSTPAGPPDAKPKTDS